MKRLIHKKLAIIVFLIIESVVIMKTYGATVNTDYHPCLAYDTENNHYIVMYTSNWFGLENFVFGQLINAEGTPSELIIRPIDDYSASPAIAYDNINKNSLVVSMTGLGDTGTDIVGQFISADGSVNGNNFIISDANINQDFPVGQYVILDRDFPALSFDTSNQRFLVVWSDGRNRDATGTDIVGQFVNADGSLDGSNFFISDANNDQNFPVVSYDTANQRFFVVWSDGRNDDAAGTDIVGQLVNADGSLNGGNFFISDANNDQRFPVVSFDTSNQRFLVVWSDGRNGDATGTDIVGQLVNVDGSLNGGNFFLSDAINDQDYPVVSFDSTHQRFFVAWVDGISGDAAVIDIVGQFVSSDGTQNGNSFIITDGTGYEPRRLAVAYNPTADNFLVSFDGKTDCDVVNIVSCIGYAIIEDSDSGSTSDGGGCFITNAASR